MWSLRGREIRDTIKKYLLSLILYFLSAAAGKKCKVLVSIMQNQEKKFCFSAIITLKMTAACGNIASYPVWKELPP
jgi:hypothetical protein